jgi:ADP-ribose pyrophosphatase YjhB (NUDIX family)
MTNSHNIPITYAAFTYLIDEEKRVLLVANNYEGHDTMWGLPGGTMEAGEKPEECAVRECLEEVGVEIKIKKFVGAIERVKEEWKLNLYAHFFEGEIISGSPRVDPNEEHVIGYKFLSADEVLNFPETILGRKYIANYINSPGNYPKHIVMSQDEE